MIKNIENETLQNIEIHIEEQDKKIKYLLEACKEAREYLQYNKGNASPIYDHLQQAIIFTEGRFI